MRLDQFLSTRTMYSRRELKQLIAKGNVTVNGKTVTQPGFALQQQPVVCLYGNTVPSSPYLYILLHKPAGYVCSASEPGQHSVLELIPPQMRRKNLQPVGRLDKDSTGLLLLTDDGQYAHQIIAARSHAAKIYHITLARPWESFYEKEIAAGMTLGDGAVCLPAQAICIPETEREALICLHEGKYHQVRRMFAALGNHVNALSRIAIGGLILPHDLEIGGSQILEDQDIQKTLQEEADFIDLIQNIRHNS